MGNEKLIEDSVKLLRKMVSVPSPSFGEEGVRDAIDKFLNAVGICHTLLHNNIVAFNKNFCSSKKTLMLCAHIDTVPAADDYDFDPYNPDYKEVTKVLNLSGEKGEKDVNIAETGKIKKEGVAMEFEREDKGKKEMGEKVDNVIEEVVAGLGANDDGASVAAMLAVFRHFYEAELPINLVLVLSAEEERSGKRGMDIVWKIFKESGIGPMDEAPKWAIVGEPTGMRAAKAERGLLVLDCVATGKSGHAARNEGVNAIYVALEDIEKLRNVSFERKSPLMGENKITVTQINAGTAHNVVPDKCSFVVDVRPTEQYSNPEILSILQEVCRSELKARNLNNHSSATSKDSPLLRAAEMADIDTFVSPTTSDWMRIDCDAVKMGPGESSRSHHKNEYVTISEIRDGVEKYISFIETFSKLIDK